MESIWFVVNPGTSQSETAIRLLLDHLTEHFGEVEWVDGVGCLACNVPSGKQQAFLSNHGVHGITYRNGLLRTTSFVRIDIDDLPVNGDIVKRHVYWPYRMVKAIPQKPSPTQPGHADAASPCP